MTGDFWKSAGLHLLRRREDGWLEPTAAFLRAYYARPEVHPMETSCAEEIRLHDDLMADPELAVEPDRLALIADPDSVDAYRAVLGLRDLLLGAGSVEEAYLRAVRAERIDLPSVFLDQMVHVILRNALEGVADPIRLRAAELLFREQRVSTDDGRIMLADEEIVDMRAASSGGQSGLAQLLAASDTPMREVSLDVLGEDNAALYWSRSDRFDTVIDFRFGQPANEAFGRVIETWLRHLLRLEVQVTPLAEIKDPDWRWHIGLDREANAILNALYEGRDPGLAAHQRIVGLFRMRINDDGRILERVRGKPVYLGLAMSDDKKLRMKPQNLIANLPLRETS